MLPPVVVPLAPIGHIAADVLRSVVAECGHNLRRFQILDTDPEQHATGFHTAPECLGHYSSQ